MKNQIRVFIILLAVLLFISGCVQSPPSTSSMTGNSDTSVPTVGTTDAPAVNIDLTADWKTPDVETAACAAFSDEGYYYFNNGYLHFLDTQNGISVILCHRAGCKHDDYECEASLGASMMFYHDGYLYYNDYVQEDPYSIHLFRRKADGTAEEKVTVLGQEYISQNTSLVIGEYIVADGFLYFTTYIQESIKMEDGSFLVMERDGILLRLDLKTGKQTEILRKRDTLIRLFGARKDALLFYTQDRIPAEENLELDYYEKMLNKPARLQVWSESAGDCVTLFEKPNKECKWILGLQRGKVYYTDDVKYYAYELATEIHAELDWTEYYMLVNENYLLDLDGNTPEEEVIKYTKFIDIRTGQYVPSDYDDAVPKVLNVTDRGCVLQITYLDEPIKVSEGSYITPRLRQIVAYVAFDSLEDGLQESDLLVIRDEKFEE